MGVCSPTRGFANHDTPICTHLQPTEFYLVSMAMCTRGRWHLLAQAAAVVLVGLDSRCDGLVPSPRLPVSPTTGLGRSSDAPASARGTRRPRSQHQELSCLTPIPRCAAASYRPLLDQHTEGLRSDVSRRYWKHERMLLQIPPPPPLVSSDDCDA